MNSRRIVSLARWFAAAGALAGIVTVYTRFLHANQTTVALTLLLFILILAARWGLRQAVTFSVAATIAYNYYFLPPVHTFTIADPQNWLALIAFLTTAVIASRLSARIREEALEARTRQREVELLFQLSRDLLQTDRVSELIHAVPGSIALIAHARTVLLFLTEAGAELADSTAESKSRIYRAGDTSISPPDQAELHDLMMLPSAARLEGDRIAVPLRAGVRPRGVLLVEGVALSNETFDAMGGLVSIAVDRAQALEEVTRGEAAKESERLRGVLLDSITHELRTPLTSIKAAVSTLLEGHLPDEASRREMLEVIDEEGDRLNHLVAQAVEMAQLDAREVNIHLEPETVASLLDDIAERTGGLVASREIVLHVPATLPHVLIDPTWIGKVLANLLDNAAKYSPPEEPIVVTAERRGPRIAISVADRGIGIDPMEQTLIFDKFYRVKSQIQRVPGTGMGLAICRAILEAHGGTLTLTSQPGKGSVFTFDLPVA